MAVQNSKAVGGTQPTALPSSPIQCRYGIVGLSRPAPRPHSLAQNGTPPVRPKKNSARTFSLKRKSAPTLCQSSGQAGLRGSDAKGWHGPIDLGQQALK